MKKEQIFTYTSSARIFGLLSTCLGLQVILFLVFKNLLYTIEISLGLSISVSALLFLLLKKKVKKVGKGIVKYNALLFSLENEKLFVRFKDIANYRIGHYNGTTFKLKLKTGIQHKIVANNNFCDTSAFDNLLNDFELALSDYTGKKNIEALRKKSIFEHKWMFYTLLILTAILIVLIIEALNVNNKSVGKLLFSMGILYLLWGAYYKTKKRS